MSYLFDCKFVDLMPFFFLKGKICTPEKSGTCQKFCAPDRHLARNLSRPVLIPIINKPARITATDSCRTLIDHIFINSFLNDNKNFIGIVKSDWHFCLPIFVVPSEQNVISDKKKAIVTKRDETSMKYFKEIFEEVNW